MVRRQSINRGIKLMKFRKILLGLVAFGLVGSAMADDDVKMKMSIAVMDGDGADRTHFKINSDDLDFDLHEMQEGESRSIIDEDGRSILITRVGDGFTFNIDGEIVEVPKGQSILVSVLSHRAALRTQMVSSEPRAGFCLMGACQECWMWLDDGRRVRACTTTVDAGMAVCTTAPPGFPQDD